MNFTKKLTEIRNGLDHSRIIPSEKREFITNYCVICEVFLDDPTRFTCNSPQCNKELLEFTGREDLVNLLETFNKETLKELEKYFNELEGKSKDYNDFLEALRTDSVEAKKQVEKLKSLYDELEVESVDEALKKLEEVEVLIEEIGEKIKEKNKTSPG